MEEVLARLRDGLFAALADPSLAAVREALLIAGAEPTGIADYAPVKAASARLDREGPMLVNAAGER